MHQEFELEYDSLFKALNGFNPEDEEWFFPKLLTLITKYGDDIAHIYVKNSSNAIYNTELFVKAGFRGIDKNTLLEYTKGDNEYEVYGETLSLAICGHIEGFDIINQFIDQTHRLSNNIYPLSDIFPDLKFIDTKKATILENRIRKNRISTPSHGIFISQYTIIDKLWEHNRILLQDLIISQIEYLFN